MKIARRVAAVAAAVAVVGLAILVIVDLGFGYWRSAAIDSFLTLSMGVVWLLIR